MQLSVRAAHDEPHCRASLRANSLDECVHGLQCKVVRSCTLTSTLRLVGMVAGSNGSASTSTCLCRSLEEPFEGTAVRKFLQLGVVARAQTVRQVGEPSIRCAVAGEERARQGM